jgi:hypothetical protein
VADQFDIWDMGSGSIPWGEGPDDLASIPIQETEIDWLGKVALSWLTFLQGVLLSTPALAIVIASFVPGLLPPYSNPNLPVTLSLVWWGVLLLGGSFCSRSRPGSFLLGVVAIASPALLCLLFFQLEVGWWAIPIIGVSIILVAMVELLVRHLGWRIRLSLAHRVYTLAGGLDSIALYRSDRVIDISEMETNNPRYLFSRIF